VDPTIAVVYRGAPPFKAEIVEEVDRYEFVQPNLTIYFLDGHMEAREDVMFVRTTRSDVAED